MSALGIVVVCVTIGAAAWVIRRLRQAGVHSGAAAAVAIAGLTFQAAHGFEHAVQFVNWLRSLGSPAWMSSWALAGRDALAAAVGRSPMVGVELLHLIGNTIFLAGLLVLPRLLPGLRSSRAWRLARGCQAAHVVEHVLLTATAIWFGTSVGVTTWFGALDPAGAGAVGMRVGTHFALNAIPTVLIATVLARSRGSERRPRPPTPVPPSLVSTR
jgi:hypothetical protein